LPENARILVVRPDRIGDVVLSTPVFTSIRIARPGWKIAALVRPMVAPLLEGHPDMDEVISLPTDDKPSFSNTRPLAADLGAKRFDVALHLYSDFWISLAVWMAGIRIRIGPASKLAKIFYNIPVAQKRSRGNRHEADYNLDLLTPLGIPPVRRSSIAVSEAAFPAAAGLLDSARKNVGVFPGMGGSARNWKPEKYAALIDLLDRAGINVILMGGPAESALLDAVESLAAAKPKRFVGAELKQLAAVLARLDCFVAPSTGPLHIATAVGTPAVGIYCPIRVCLPRRWGPIGEKDVALMPDVPACGKCEPQCAHYDCMDSLSPESAARAVKERL